MVAVGISGGVDSAVAARLLQLRGERIVGVTMTLGRTNEAESVAAARQVADQLGIPLEVLDLEDDWRRMVTDYIRATYLAGRTPNPCVRCNEMVKFGLLPRLALERFGCERFATGHYARLAGGRLLRAVDRLKDQSYFLYRVAPEVLALTELPLGGLTKAEVREKAREFGFAAAERGDSQDFCGGDPMAVVGEADRPGNIVTEAGEVIGRHRGFWHYTIGKRKGLGVGGGTPYYVVALRAERNEVVVGFRAATMVREFRVGELVGAERLEGELTVKVRSAGEPKGPVRVTVADGVATVSAPEGISGVAPGQSAVFYRDDALLGGGIII